MWWAKQVCETLARLRWARAGTNDLVDSENPVEKHDHGCWTGIRAEANHRDRPMGIPHDDLSTSSLWDGRIRAGESGPLGSPVVGALCTSRVRPVPAGSAGGFSSVSQCGVEQLAARRAHNPEVAGSSPAPATITTGWALPPAGPPPAAACGTWIPQPLRDPLRPAAAAIPGQPNARDMGGRSIAGEKDRSGALRLLGVTAGRDPHSHTAGGSALGTPGPCERAPRAAGIPTSRVRMDAADPERGRIVQPHGQSATPQCPEPPDRFRALLSFLGAAACMAAMLAALLWWDLLAAWLGQVVR